MIITQQWEKRQQRFPTQWKLRSLRQYNLQKKQDHSEGDGDTGFA